MKNLLVTGANGFVGSHVLAAAGEYGVTPIALVRDPRRLPEGYKGEVRIGDIRDRAFVERALEDIDAVCMCAAWTSVWGNAEASREYFLEPTLNFLGSAVKQGIQRIVFPSSTSAQVMRNMPGGALRGSHDSLWPHLSNVIRIEDRMQALADTGTTMLALRLGLFTGERYGLGVLPVLLPRLRSHLVPWVGKGRTAMPLIGGPDIGEAMVRAAIQQGIEGYHAPDVVGKEVPTVREVIGFLHEAYGYPRPHFNVSFNQAFAFARLMESVSRFTPWDPFITRSVILLLHETAASNVAARKLFGYQPRVDWKDAVRAQLAHMQRDRVKGLRMARAKPPLLHKARTAG